MTISPHLFATLAPELPPSLLTHSTNESIPHGTSSHVNSHNEKNHTICIILPRITLAERPLWTRARTLPGHLSYSTPPTSHLPTHIPLLPSPSPSQTLKPAN